jgi:hypothetical protein
VKALCVATYKVQQKVSYESSRGPLWTGFTRAGNEKIVITKKKDRRPLLIMSDSKGQILQVSMQQFDPEPEKALQPALAFMVGIGEDLVSGICKKVDLVRERDDRLKRLSMVCKRPAASTAAAKPPSVPVQSSVGAASSSSSAAAGPPATGAGDPAPATPPAKRRAAVPMQLSAPPCSTGEVLDMPWADMPY